MPDLKLTLLGSFSTLFDEKPLQPFQNKAVQALLIYLVCQPDQPHRREHLMTLEVELERPVSYFLQILVKPRCPGTSYSPTAQHGLMWIRS